MGTLTEILSRAQQRAKEHNLPYEGALTPQEAYQVLQLAPACRLVDVRTRQELDLVGHIPNVTHIEWAFYPEWKPNPDFLTQLGMQVDREALVMFICRSGARSDKSARAATQAGYTDCYNVLEGFEGDTDHVAGQRGKINGWRLAGLPWTNA